MDWFSLIQVCRCPGFVHNWLTRAQQGGFAASLVSFPYPVPKTAQRAAQGRVLVFSPERAYPSPFRGRGDGILFIFGVSGSPWQLPVATAGHSWLNRAGLGLCWCRSPTRPPKSHTGPHRGEFGFTAFSWCASFAAAQQTVVPGGNSPPPG